MKKSMFFLWVLTLCSCAYDNAEDLYGEGECPPDGVSFTQKILPIIQSNCAVSGCHVNGQQSPTLESYTQIANYANKIKEWTSDGIMPPSTSGKSLTSDEINSIACWVDAGAVHN